MAQEYYDLSIEEIIKAIKKEEAKRVLIQLPDGLKPEAAGIQQEVKKEIPDVELIFWGGSAFGACDVPLNVERLGVELLIHLGHATWR